MAENYFYLPGATGSYASVPDHSNFDFAGDFEIRVRVAMDDWTPGSSKYFVGKYSTAGNRSYALYITGAGNLTLLWQDSSLTQFTESATVVTGLANKSVQWIRATLDVDNGASDAEVKFYLGGSDVTPSWTQLGDTVLVGATTDVDTGTADISIGNLNGATGTGSWAGAVYNVELWSGIAGTKVLSADFASLTATELAANEFTEDSSTGHTVTLNGTGWAYVRPTTNTLLQRAELLLEAGDGNEGGSALWADRSGNDHHATPTNSPTFLAYDGEQYLWLPGSASNFALTNDNSAIRLTDDLDFRFDVQLDDWSPASDVAFVDKTGGSAGYAFWVDSSGNFVFRTGSGSAYTTWTSSAANSITDGARAVVRATLDRSEGNVTFYVDGVQLGAVVNQTAATISHTAAQLRIGAFQGASKFLAGRMYYGRLYNGIGGSLVYDASFNLVAEPFASFTEPASGLTCTINRAASGYVSTVVDRDMWVLNGSNTYLTVADDNDLDFAAGESFSLLVVGRSPGTPSANQIIVGKADFESSAGYRIYLSSTFSVFRIANGASPLDATSLPAANTLFTLGGVRNVTDDNIEIFSDGVPGGSPATDTTTATLANAIAFNIGRQANATARYFPGQIIAVALFREALTDAEMALVTTMLSNPDAGDPTELHGDALWWWIQQYEGRISGNDTELVGELNALNGTSDKEYAGARGTYLSVDPAG